jgi:endonuclease III
MSRSQGVQYKLFYILLTKKTPPERYLQTFREFQHHFKPWEKLLEAEVSSVESVLHPLGMFRVRTKQIKAIAKSIFDTFGSVDLEPLRLLPVAQAKLFLLSLPGVGEKSARCVLMYSLGQDVSPMDAHAVRVLQRFGLLPSSADARRAHVIMDGRLPEGLALALHVNLVEHSRTTCRARAPKCEVCPVALRCSFYSEKKQP